MHYKIWRDFLIIWPQEYIFPKLENHGFQNMWNFDPERSEKTGKISKNGDASWFILTRSVQTSYLV